MKYLVIGSMGYKVGVFDTFDAAVEMCKSQLERDGGSGNFDIYECSRRIPTRVTETVNHVVTHACHEIY